MLIQQVYFKSYRVCEVYSHEQGCLMRPKPPVYQQESGGANQQKYDLTAGRIEQDDKALSTNSSANENHSGAYINKDKERYERHQLSFELPSDENYRAGQHLTCDRNNGIQLVIDSLAVNLCVVEKAGAKQVNEIIYYH